MINVSATWLRGGFGLARPGCTVEPAWNAWRCAAPAPYRMLVIENMDNDHEIRRMRLEPKPYMTLYIPL